MKDKKGSDVEFYNNIPLLSILFLSLDKKRAKLFCFALLTFRDPVSIEHGLRPGLGK